MLMQHTNKTNRHADVGKNDDDRGGGGGQLLVGVSGRHSRGHVVQADREPAAHSESPRTAWCMQSSAISRLERAETALERLSRAARMLE
jgi:hypothetical protein